MATSATKLSTVTHQQSRLISARMSKLESALWWQLRATMPANLPVSEYRFHDERRWRFDFAWPALRLAVEVEGLVRPGGKSRHTTNRGYSADCEKYNAAALDGWCVLRYTGKEIKNGSALAQIELAIAARK